MRPKIQLALDCDNTEQAIKACQGGVVDEVIVGREVLTRWPELLRSIIKYG